MNYSFRVNRGGQLVTLIAALIVVCTGLLYATPAYAVTAAEKEAEAQEALTQLHAMQDTLEQTSAQYYQSLAEYQDAVNLRDKAQDRIDEISDEIKEIQTRLGSRARDMYRNGSSSFIDLLFGATTFDEFTQSWDMLNRLNVTDATLSSKAKALRTETQEKKAEYDKQANIAEQKSKDAQQAFKESQELVSTMEDTYNSLSAEAAALYQQEQEAAAAAAAAAAEAAAAEAAAQAAAAAQVPQYTADNQGYVADDGAYAGDAGDATYTETTYTDNQTAVQNDDGTVTDTSTGQTYSSASDYSASTGNEIVDRAYSMLGSSYRYGGTGADGSFDCSGLVGYAITGTTERIGNTTTFMGYNQVSDPQPGDIVVNEGHTGIYIGDGQMIHAQDESAGVVVGKVQDGMIYVRP